MSNTNALEIVKQLIKERTGQDISTTDARAIYQDVMDLITDKITKHPEIGDGKYVIIYCPDESEECYIISLSEFQNSPICLFNTKEQADEYIKSLHYQDKLEPFFIKEIQDDRYYINIGDAMQFKKGK